jgi:hypothetical protein
MTAMDSTGATRYIGAHFKGRAVWTPEAYALLRELCAQRASWNDLEAAFPTWGQNTIMLGMRDLIYDMVQGEIVHGRGRTPRNPL